MTAPEFINMAKELIDKVNEITNGTTLLSCPDLGIILNKIRVCGF